MLLTHWPQTQSCTAQLSIQKQEYSIKLTLWHTFINVSWLDFILKSDNTILVIINLEIKTDKNYIFRPHVLKTQNNTKKNEIVNYTILKSYNDTWYNIHNNILCVLDW